MSTKSQRRRRAVRAAAPAAGLLAAGLLVWQGSVAAFSASTDNGSESWATGSLTLQNDGGSGAYAASTTPIFAELNLKFPSASVSRCLTVKAGGTTGGTLNFYRGAITAGGTGGAIAPQIALTIKAMPVTATAPVPAVTTNCTNWTGTGATTLTPVNTTLASLPSTYGTGLGGLTVPVGTQYVVYQFTYQLTSTGSNAGDNLLQGSTASAPFTFEIQ